MKKSLLGLMIASIIGVSSSALAGGPDYGPPPVMFKPFVGVYYSYLSAESVNSVYGTPVVRAPDSFNGIGFEGGVKYGRYVGMAFGWTHYFRETRTTAIASGSTGTTDYTAAARPENYYFEIRGYYPIYNFDLIGALGANIFDAGSAINPTGTTNPQVGTQYTTHVNLRVGVGADYFFTPNWNVFVMWNYVPHHGTFYATGFQNFWTLNVGLGYMFS